MNQQIGLNKTEQHINKYVNQSTVKKLVNVRKTVKKRLPKG